MNILDKIVESKRHEVNALRTTGYYRAISAALVPPTDVPSMATAVRQSATGIIAEFKRRSPSKGLINGSADIETVVSGYAQTGAAACSVLTDTPFFGGSTADLVRARSVARDHSLPLLRKEFIVAHEQIDEARLFGASAVLLIASVLTADELADFAAHAKSSGLETLVEIHSLAELDKLSGVNADMVGVNSRDLTNMTTDLSHAMRLGDAVASRCSNALLIAESGITCFNDILQLRKRGYSGFLIGEHFMREANPAKALHNFLNVGCTTF
jgi:indole-3-glycerol phosphate synthase